MVKNPYVSTRWFSMDANVIPCRGSLLFESIMDTLYDYSAPMKSIFSDTSGVISMERKVMKISGILPPPNRPPNRSESFSRGFEMSSKE